MSANPAFSRTGPVSTKYARTATSLLAPHRSRPTMIRTTQRLLPRSRLGRAARATAAPRRTLSIAGWMQKSCSGSRMPNVLSRRDAILARLNERPPSRGSLGAGTLRPAPGVRTIATAGAEGMWECPPASACRNVRPARSRCGSDVSLGPVGWRRRGAGISGRLEVVSPIDGAP